MEMRIIPISKHVGGLIETLSEKHLAQCYAYSRCSINATLQRREMAYSMNTVQKVAFGRGGGAAAKLSQVWLSPSLSSLLGHLEQVLTPLSLGSIVTHQSRFLKKPKHQFHDPLAFSHKTCQQLLKVF